MVSDLSIRRLGLASCEVIPFRFGSSGFLTLGSRVWGMGSRVRGMEIGDLGVECDFWGVGLVVYS